MLRLGLRLRWPATVGVMAVIALCGRHPAPAATRLPFTYCIDYAGQNVNAVEFRRAVAAGPPCLMHVGMQVPFKARVGASHGYYDSLKSTLAGPGELREQIEALERHVTDLHHRGVSIVIPYLVNSEMWGSYKRRLGFWEFYDHWNDYADFGIGPRPSDPINWMQHPYSPDDPNDHSQWGPCPNNDDWTDYLCFATKWAARCGYDGVFMDVNTIGGACDACQRKFREFLGSRYTAAELQNRFGITDLTTVGISDKASPPLSAEIEEFRACSIARHLARLREAGATAGSPADAAASSPAPGARRPFYVIPNFGPLAHLAGADWRRQRGLCVDWWAPVSDYIMYEEWHCPGHLGRGVVIDYELQYKLSYACGAPGVVLCYSGGGAYPYELAQAEAAAFGGGGAFVQTGTGRPEVTNLYNRFFAERRSLYEGYEPFARVGLAFLYHQWHMNDPTHLTGVYRARDYLSEQQTLWDFATDISDVRKLQRFDVLVLPGGRYLSDREIAALRGYVTGGGTLFMLGEVGSHDPWGRKRSSMPFAHALSRAVPDQRGVYRGRLGRGRVLWAMSPWAVLPQRPFALYDLKEAEVNNTKLVYKRIAAAPAQSPGAAGRAFVDYLAPANGKRIRLASSPAPYLRFNAYRKGVARAGELTLHAVNYNVPRPAADRRDFPVPSAAAPLAFDAPQGWRFVTATRYTTDGKSYPLKFTQRGQRVTFTLPPINIYTVIRFATKGAGRG